MNDNNITSAIVSGILNSEAFAGAIRSAIEKQISSALSDAQHYVHLKSLVEDQVEVVLDGMDLREHITDAMSGMDADDMGMTDAIDEAVRSNLNEHEVRAGDILGLDEAVKDEVCNTNWEEVLEPVLDSTISPMVDQAIVDYFDKEDHEKWLREIIDQQIVDAPADNKSILPDDIKGLQQYVMDVCNGIRLEKEDAMWQGIEGLGRTMFEVQERISKVELGLHDAARDIAYRAQEISDLLSNMAAKFAELANKEQI
jgi:hypothetical protein